MSDIDNKSTANTTIPIRPCPFCGSEAQILTSHDPVRYGVQCPACRALFLPVHETQLEALMRWNRRSGTVSAAGGRGTRGISTAKKRRACRKNLAAAREAKKIIRIKSETEYAIAQLRPLREAEQIRLECLAKRSQTRLATLIPQITADPVLSRMLALLKPGQAISDPGPPVKDPLPVKREFAAAP